MNTEFNPQSMHFSLLNHNQPSIVFDASEKFNEQIRKYILEHQDYKKRIIQSANQNKRLLQQNVRLNQQIETISKKLLDCQSISISKSIKMSDDALSYKQSMQKQKCVNEQLRIQLQQSQRRQYDLELKQSYWDQLQVAVKKKVLTASQKLQKFQRILQCRDQSISQSNSSNILSENRAIHSDQYVINPIAQIKTFSSVQKKKKLENIQQSLDRILSVCSKSTIYHEKFKAQLEAMKKSNQHLKKQLQGEIKLRKQYQNIVENRKEKLKQNSQILVNSSSTLNSGKSDQSVEPYKLIAKLWRNKHNELKERYNQISSFCKGYKIQ